MVNKKDERVKCPLLVLNCSSHWTAYLMLSFSCSQTWPCAVTGLRRWDNRKRIAGERNIVIPF